MVNHGSANQREETPHVTNAHRTTVSNAVRRRAEFIISDYSIDAQSRAVIRYGLETNDPRLAELVRRVDAGEAIVEMIDCSQSAVLDESNSVEEKIEALAEMICEEDDVPGTKWAALMLLMSALENSTHPKALANTVKHLAFSRCGETNIFGIVDAQIALLEGELFSVASGS